MSDSISGLMPANAFLGAVVIVVIAAWGLCWLVLPFLVVGIFDRLGDVRAELRALNGALARRAGERGEAERAPPPRAREPLIRSPPG